MKIGIIGLLTAQAATIVRAYPDVKISFLSRERERESAKFAQAHPKVILMTKFISHSTFASVPVHKRVPVAGGMTDLKRVIDKLIAESPEFVKPKRDLKPVKTEETVMRPSTSHVTDWNLLLAAKEKDELTFWRADDVTPYQFRVRITAQRSYYKRTHGVVTVCAFVGDRKAIVTVVSPDAASPAKEKPWRRADPAQAELWKNFALARATTGANIGEVIADADAFIEAYRNRFAS